MYVGRMTEYLSFVIFAGAMIIVFALETEK